MMITPEQATNVWCPMVRIARREENITHSSDPADPVNAVNVTNHVVAGCNTDALGRNRVPASCRCIADKCAMWRWGTKDDPTWKRPANPPASFQPAPQVRADFGYCGLAGHPCT